MEIRDIATLTRPDPRVRHFTYRGLSTAGVLAPEDSAAFIQEIVSRYDLVPAVPEATRQSFERLRSTHTYGLFCYDLFTVADDLSLLVLELALAERFMAYYGGRIPFTLAGEESPLVTSSFTAVYDAVNRGGSHSKGAWRLRSLATNAELRFRATLTDLLAWARHEGLLRGQRTRRIDKALVDFRNDVAHPHDYHLGSPIDSSRGIGQLAEIINRLWGSDTSGGRLFPAPYERDILAIGWQAGEFSCGLAEQLEQDDRRASRTYLIVKGAFHDDWLGDFDSDTETTLFPTEWLWGPGTADDAIRWLAVNSPTPDTADYLDRCFVIREKQGEVDRPRRVGIFAGLHDDDERSGTWYLLHADFPLDAWAHVRSRVNGVAECAADGPCDRCGVNLVGSGKWADVLLLAKGRHLSLKSETLRGVRVPDIGLFSHWR